MKDAKGIEDIAKDFAKRRMEGGNVYIQSVRPSRDKNVYVVIGNVHKTTKVTKGRIIKSVEEKGIRTSLN